jgi:bacillopeptidase F (M6 metalloprotease family)
LTYKLKSVILYLAAKQNKNLEENKMKNKMNDWDFLEILETDVEFENELKEIRNAEIRKNEGTKKDAEFIKYLEKANAVKKENIENLKLVDWIF